MKNALTFLLADSWMHGGWGWGWGWTALVMVAMVLFWGAVIVGVVWLIRNTVSSRPDRKTDASVTAAQLAGGRQR